MIPFKAHLEPQHLEQCGQVHPPPLRPHLRRQAAQQVHCGQGPLGGAGDDDDDNAHANDVDGDDDANDVDGEKEK